MKIRRFVDESIYLLFKGVDFQEFDSYASVVDYAQRLR